jgi:hypothetical protein
MHFLLGTISKEIPSSDLIVDCLWCGQQQTNAHVRQRTELLMLFHLIPLFPLRTVFVQCSSCHQDMVANCSLEELAQSNPLTLKYILAKRMSLVGKVCVVLGLLLCWAFWIGLIPAIVGFIYGRRYGGWMKKWGTVGLILNLLSPLIFILLLMIVRLLSK